MILVTGGDPGGVPADTASRLLVAEVLSAASTPMSPICTLPPLPDTRSRHPQDGDLACGGSFSTTSTSAPAPSTCVRLSAEAGGWVLSHNLLQTRYHHSSWQSPAGLLLLGGAYPGTGFTTELLSSDSTSSYSFTLDYDTP